MSFYLFFSLALVALWEMHRPRRALRASMRRRWIAHLGLALINDYGMAWVLPAAGSAAALLAAEKGGALFNMLSAPQWLAVPGSLLLLDFIFYAQHRLMHSIPFLWRLHRLHHDDPDVDFTTGFRHHPFEALFSYTVALVAISLIGPPVIALIIFQVVFAVMNLFSHGNVSLPAKVDRILRYIVITPDMHRVHHSALLRETNSNYGQILSMWDHLFGSYCAQPANGHNNMTLGLDEFSDQKHIRLDWMLFNPFLAPKTTER